MGKKKCIFWISDTDRILTGIKPPEAIGGANVQLAFWAKCFADHGWKSYSLTYDLKNSRKKIYGIQYLYFPLIRYVMFILHYGKIFYLFFIRPDLVVTRAQPLDLKVLLFLSKILKFKLVHMLASDMDVVPRDDGRFTKFQKLIKELDFVIAQNEFQQISYRKAFRQIYIPIIPNIWDSTVFFKTTIQSNSFEIIWVANFRKIKRPHLFVELAKALPNFSFAMIGLEQESKVYADCVKSAAAVKNLYVLGYKSLFETTSIISQAKILVCSSIAEGFPNTFLQAWSAKIPVVSTVNPNGIIDELQLGVFSTEFEGLTAGISKLMVDKEFYSTIQKSIVSYFDRTHKPNVNFNVFAEYIS